MPALESYYKKSVIPNNTTSAEVASALTDEVGTGFIVLSNSPNLTGTPTAPTAAPETNTTQIATTAFVDFAVNNIKTIKETVKNVSGSTLQRGTPVHVTGNSGNEAEVIAADAANNYPAQFILDENLINGATGLAVALGFINNVSVPDASIYTPGEEVWLGSGGGWTTSKPTGTNVIQKLGLILKVNTGNDTISGIVYGLGMEEGLPNLSEGNTWVGDSNSVPQETTLGSAAFLTAGTAANNLVQLDSEGKLPVIDGSQLTNLPAGGLTPVPVTNADSPYTASVNQLLLVDTNAGEVVINLPASGSDAIVQVSDVGGNAGTNSITINRAGSDTILSDTAMTVTDDYAGAILAIDSTQTDWKVAGFTVPLGGNGGGSGLNNPVDTLYRSIQTVTYNDAGTSTMDNGTHDVFSLTANGGTGTTIAHSNVPITGNEYTFRLHLTWTSGTITWPTSWTKGMNAPTATGSYIIQGVTIDGGTSWTISVVYQ